MKKQEICYNIFFHQHEVGCSARQNFTRLKLNVLEINYSETYRYSVGFFGCLFSYPFIMRVEYFLQIRVPIYSKARDYCLGKGVKFYADEICDALVLFLFDEFEKNPSCLLGDIRGLLLKKAEIDQKRLGEMTYREYLQEQVKNGVYSI